MLEDIMETFTIDDLPDDLTGKTIFVRADIDSPYEAGKIVDNDRLIDQAPMLKKLSKRGARIVVAGHQSRPGKPDCTTTKQHAKLLSKHSEIKIRYIPSIYGPKAVKAIKALIPSRRSSK